MNKFIIIKVIKMTITKQELINKINEVIEEIEQSQLNLIGSLQDELEENSDASKDELERLLRDVQTELDNQHDNFVRY